MGNYLDIFACPFARVVLDGCDEEDAVNEKVFYVILRRDYFYG